MYTDPETYRSLARERERELIEEAKRERLLKAVREGRGRHDTKRRSGV